MKYFTSALIMAVFLAGSAEGVTYNYRPHTDGKTPWYKTSPKEPSTEFPHDYFVPSFGADPEIAATKQHEAAAAAKLGKK